MESEKREFPTKNEAIVLLIITIVFFFMSEILLMSVLSSRIEIFLAEAMIIVPALVFVYKKGYSFEKTFRLKRINPAAVIASLIIGVALIILSDELDRLVKLVFPIPEEFTELEDQFNKTLQFKSVYDFIIILLSAVGMAAVFEEMLFRGLIQKALENAMDITRAVIFTAFFFAFIHIWPWNILQILILGIFLGFLAWRSDSVWPAVIIHGLINCVSLFLNNTSLEAPYWYEWKGHVSPIFVGISIYLLVEGIKKFYKIYQPYV